MARELRAWLWAMAQQGPVTAARRRLEGPATPRPTACHRQGGKAMDEKQPRYGATRDGVQRVPASFRDRGRQAPDGYTEGGSQPTALRVIHRRHSGLRLCQWLKEKRRQTSEKVLPPLDIGRHINAAPQPRPEAGAQRTLEGVGCRRCSAPHLGEPCGSLPSARGLARTAPLTWDRLRP